MPRLKNKIKIANKIKQKSIETYLLCIEIYNKPTINYRIEASSYFICNAWELLLKAFYIEKNGEKSIYRPNSTQTYSLEEMLNKCFEDNSPIKKNLKIIIEKIRNKSTHLIIKEHDILYTPLLQKAVLNYSEFLRTKFNINIADKIPFEYLALISRKELEPKAISKLYSKSYAKIFDDDFRFIQKEMSETVNDDESIFAHVNYTLAFTKDIQQADIKAYYNKDSAVGLKPITIAKDVNASHPYSMKQVIETVKKLASERNLNYDLSKLNNSRLTDFNKYNKIFNHPEYFNPIDYGTNILKKYSNAYIEFIMSSLEQNNDLFAKKNKE